MGDVRENNTITKYVKKYLYSTINKNVVRQFSGSHVTGSLSHTKNAYLVSLLVALNI